MNLDYVKYVLLLIPSVDHSQYLRRKFKMHHFISLEFESSNRIKLNKHVASVSNLSHQSRAWTCINNHIIFLEKHHISTYPTNFSNFLFLI